MRNEHGMTALLQFDNEGELQGVFPCCKNDEDEKILRDAIERLIRPSLWEWVARLFSSRS